MPNQTKTPSIPGPVENAPPKTQVHPPEGQGEASASSLIDKANEAANRLEAGNKELARLLGIQEQNIIQQKLGGRSDAGQPPKTKEQEDLESAKKLLEGTGYESLFG